MTSIELFQEGRLREAIQLQDRFVHSHPEDAAGRLLLCDLLLHTGDLTGVRNHLDKLSCVTAGMEDYRSACRFLVDGEEIRRRVWASGTADNPRFLVAPPEHLQERVKALEAYRSNNLKACIEHLDRA